MNNVILKKKNLESVQKEITEIEDYLSNSKNIILNDVGTLSSLADYFNHLADLKDARLIMQTQIYKRYEEAGKTQSWEEFREEDANNS